MEFIQDLCIKSLMQTNILQAQHKQSYHFDNEILMNHPGSFNTEYNYEDARFLLQLSLMVTAANQKHVPLELPNFLEDNPIMYGECPVESPKTQGKINHTTALAHVIYDARNNVVFIVFTGTSNECLVNVDMKFQQINLQGINNYVEGMRGHAGIFVAYRTIQQDLFKILKKYTHNKPQIVVCGHSLGGALSELCTFELAYHEPIHYSFAAPLFFNPIGANAFDHLVKHSYRVGNLSDLVINAPLPVMPNNDCFCHVGDFVWFQNNKGDYLDNHSLAYVEQFELKYVLR